MVPGPSPSPPHTLPACVIFLLGAGSCAAPLGEAAGLGWAASSGVCALGRKVTKCGISSRFFLPGLPPPSLSSLSFYVSGCLCRASAAPCLPTPCTNVLVTAVKSWAREKEEEEGEDEGAWGPAGGGSARPCAEPAPWGGSERRLLLFLCVCAACVCLCVCVPRGVWGVCSSFEATVCEILRSRSGRRGWGGEPRCAL